MQTRYKVKVLVRSFFKTCTAIDYSNKVHTNYAAASRELDEALRRNANNPTVVRCYMEVVE